MELTYRHLGILKGIINILVPERRLDIMDMEKKIVTFLDEDGQKIEFELIDVLQIENDKYALMALEGNEEDAYVYKIVEIDGKEEYLAVDDDDEFERVLEEYNSYFDEE